MKMINLYNAVYVSCTNTQSATSKKWNVNFSNDIIRSCRTWHLTWRQLDAKLTKMGYYYVGSSVEHNTLLYHFAKLG